MFSNTPMFSSTPASTSNTNTLFGAQTSTATNNTSTLFGANPPSTTIPTSTSSSVFGGLSNTNNAVNTNSNTLTGSNTSFNTINNSFGSASTPFNLNNSSNNTLNTLDPNNANQKPKLLDLDACMETVVPLYVVTANNVTRTSIPSNFFQKEGTSSNSIPIETKDGVSSPASFGSSLVSSNHSSTLPTYLTCYDNNHSSGVNHKSAPSQSFGFKKRTLDDIDTPSPRRNVLSKSEIGVFTRKPNEKIGFQKNLSKLENTTVPIQSCKDIGFTYTTSKNLDTARYGINGIPLDSIFGTSYSLGEPSNKTRVRVFGYNQDNIEEIIKHFTSIGDLAEPYISQGNWITFNYVNSDSARKAVTFNGMNIDANHLIGVTYDERAQEVENLQYQPYSESSDLYAKNDGFLGLFSKNATKQQEQDSKSIHSNNKESNFLNKLKEKILGW